MDDNGNHPARYSEEGNPHGISGRRDFMKYLLAGSALSIGAIEKLNAGIYQSITSLNQKYVEDISPDGVYWDEIRKQYLFEDKLIMMNNGTVGPMPKPVFNTLMRYFKIQMSNPYDLYNFVPGGKEGVRTKLAAFVGASADEVAFSSNTTEGLNLVANGLDLKEGDEVIVSNLEHPGAINPWNLKAKRFGVKIVKRALEEPEPALEDVLVGAEPRPLQAGPVAQLRVRPVLQEEVEETRLEEGVGKQILHLGRARLVHHRFSSLRWNRTYDFSCSPAGPPWVFQSFHGMAMLREITSRSVIEPSCFSQEPSSPK